MTWKTRFARALAKRFGLALLIFGIARLLVSEKVGSEGTFLRAVHSRRSEKTQASQTTTRRAENLSMDFSTECVYRPLEAQLVAAGFIFGVVVFLQLVVGLVRRFRRSQAPVPAAVRWILRASALYAVILCIWAGLYFADETRRGVATWRTAAKIELHQALGPGLVLLGLTAATAAVWRCRAGAPAEKPALR